MRTLRSINTSAAIIVLICFFLPWEQISCAGARDSLSGLDLARHDQGLLWFVPVLMGALVLSNIVRIRRQQNKALSLASVLSGLVTAYLLNRERLRVHDESGVISAALTGWFWLAFISAIAVMLSGFALLMKRQRAP